ncbi:sigma-70 family RNA polymerase sigma factor [Neobacillus jeddahensis]|uniref:sigma-70 family RNA polymerase sigma factor n=1 Tax=Neobacillus jeddahensis TaxID=1461580 RepID=UPI0005903D2F|nr:sigma-70 family RNA polymerase sigma factor [Neobacillus jeddahensis]
MGNFEETDYYSKKYEDYISNNEAFFNNKLIQGFLKNKENQSLLMDTICHPSENNRNLLDKTFKNFYFNIRFTSYISTALYFNTINFDKRHRKIQKRHPLIVDKPIGDSEVETFKEQICDEKAEIKLDTILQSKNIKDYLGDPALYEAVKTLTEKQIEILNLAYIHGLSDTEIGIKLKKSQQTISKTHKKAIRIISNYLTKKE